MFRGIGRRSLPFIFACLTLIVGQFLPTQIARADTPGTWVYTQNLNNPRFLHTATQLHNGNVLVRSASSAEVYDASTRTWTTTGPVVAASGEGLTASLLANGKVLIAGGFVPGPSGAVLMRSELYDPATNTWSATGDMNQARTFFSSITLPDGRVLAVGGRDSAGNILSSTELYDPTTGQWSYTGPLTEAREFSSLVLLRNGTVLVVGGDHDPGLVASTEVYSPATASWAATGDMKAARSQMFATLMPNGKVLAAGGVTVDPTSAELYDSETGQWAYTGSMATQRRTGFSGAMLPSGEAIVTGGRSENITRKMPKPTLNLAEKYNVYSGKWSSVTPMNAYREDHTTTGLADGTILVVGGSAGGVDESSTITSEVYTPINHPKVFVLLQGINSNLSKDDVSTNNTPGFATVKASIAQAVPDAQFITFSYKGPAAKGNPTPRSYTCVNTIENPIVLDVQLLDKQIQAIVASQPDVDIYLVAHSLGGAVAYSYMAALEESTGVVDPLPSANLKGVITMDSPVGGISGESTYLGVALPYYENQCPGFDRALPTALLNLSTIFGSPANSTPPAGVDDSQGSRASVLSVLSTSKITIPQPYSSNQKLALESFAAGAPTLTIGNTNDMLWLPSQCTSSTQDFISTQWIRDQGTDSGQYGRAFTSGGTNCFLDGVMGQANHLDVLSDSSVMNAIQQFLSGGTPDALNPAPLGSN